MHNDDDNIIDITAARASRAAELEQGWEETLAQHVQAFNINHAVVMVGGNARIMRRTLAEADDINGRSGFEFLKPAELSAMYEATKIQTGLKRDKYGEESIPVYANNFRAWYTHALSDVYRGGVIFRPKGAVPEGYFNTWSGFTVEPAVNDWPLIREHIEKIICGGVQELIDYFYSWVAFTVQHPDKPVGSALVLRGEKGSGKGVMGHFLRKIWGRHALHISQSKQITGNFNGHLADVCFVFADEAFFSGDKKHEGILKALVTDSVMMIERKGVEAVQQKNYLKLFMTTNNDYAVPASSDERRWGVYDVSSVKIGDDAYFDALRGECNSQSAKAGFLASMLAYDVSNWHPNQIPETTGLRFQRYSSLSSPGVWLMDSLEHGSFNSYEWEPRMLFSDLLESYQKWCNDHKMTQHDIVANRLLSIYLHKIYSKYLHPVSRCKGFVFSDLESAKAAFCDFEKVDF